MDAREFAARYPTAYHMADEYAWPSIQRYGLLSTRAMVELYNPDPGLRGQILSQRRRTSITLDSTDLGSMVVRDQLPLKFLDKCLHPGVSAQQFLDALNGRVFFWLSTKRLDTLVNALANRKRRHLVLHVDTAAMLEVYDAHAQLAPYNTGSMHVPNAPKRGPDIFTDLEDYPFEYWAKKNGNSRDHVVELTIPHAVPDITRFICKAEIRHRNDPPIPVDTT